MPNKMTDNEIIKAWEVLDSWQQVALQNDDGTDTESPKLYEAIEIVRNEINRQKAEIERLQKDSKRLKKVQMQLDDLCIMHNIIKAEAVKEFAKFLIDKKIDVVDECAEFLKEMVGENNEN